MRIRTRTPFLAAGALLASAALLLAASPSVAAGPETESITLDLSNAGTVASNANQSRLPGWQLPSGTSQDGSVTAGGEFRISNKNSPWFSHGGYVTPGLGLTAGETGIGDVNTFDVSFTVGSQTGGYQAGLSVGMAFDSSTTKWGRGGGTILFYHHGDKLKVGSFWLDEDLNTGTRPIASSGIVWSEEFFAELDPEGTYDVRAVVTFVDGPANDTIDYYIDGEHVFTGTTWEGYAAVKSQSRVGINALDFFSGSNTTSQQGLTLFSTVTAKPALTGQGLLFSDVSYSVYDVLPLPTEPPASIPPTADPAPDGALALPATATAGDTVTATGSGFAPYENVALSWYPSATFAGWTQADEWGAVSASVTVPSGFGGATHTLEGRGERSAATASGTIAVSAPPPTPGPVPTAPPTSIPPAPTETPDGSISAPESSEPEQTITVTGTGFDPYENVYFVWYSEPQFAGWAQADVNGDIEVELAVPAGFAPGETHTIQATGETSGRTLAATVVITGADASAEVPPRSLATTGLTTTGALTLAIALLIAGLAVAGLRIGRAVRR